MPRRRLEPGGPSSTHTVLGAVRSDLLEDDGAAPLSLRRVAEHAGLSRQAPYNHFENKEALLAELVSQGFDRLAAALAAGGNPKKNALEIAAEAYIRRAQEAPALFRLMFSCELVEVSRFPKAAEAGASAFNKLKEIVAAFAPADRAKELALAAWSLVHGYATLTVEMALEPAAMRHTRAHLFSSIIQTAAKVTSDVRAGMDAKGA